MTPPARTAVNAALLLATLGCSGCLEPDYIMPQPPGLEAIAIAQDEPGIATETFYLPIRLEEEEEAEERIALEIELGVTVPFVRFGDLSIALEWTLRNLGDQPAHAVIEVNGGNELAYYDPTVFLVDPDDPGEEEPPPPLMGGVPMILEGYESRNGLFREDRIEEASLDLELMSRGELNPITAILQAHEGMTDFTDSADQLYPETAFAGMVQFTLILVTTGHMMLEYAVRVRDHRDILHEELLDADPTELTTFAPVLIEPPL